MNFPQSEEFELKFNTRILGIYLVLTSNLLSAQSIEVDPVIDVVTSGRDSVAITKNGKFFLWGASDSFGPFTIRLLPTEIPNMPHFKQVVLGYSHAVGLDVDGNLWESDRMKPLSKIQVETSPKFVKLASHDAYRCAAIDDQGAVWTWGHEDTKYKVPTKIVAPDLPKFISVSTYYQTLAVDEQGRLWLWGRDYYSRGEGVNLVPTLVPSENLPRFVEVYVEASQRAALDENGYLWAWESEGVLSEEDSVFVPTIVKGLPPLSYMSPTFGLVIDKEAKLWSWGSNDDGQLGLGDREDRKTPEQIDSGDLPKFTKVYRAGGSTIALDANGMVWTWGKGRDGALGHGENRYSRDSDKLVPTLIHGFYSPKKSDTPDSQNDVSFDAIQTIKCGILPTSSQPTPDKNIPKIIWLAGMNLNLTDTNKRLGSVDKFFGGKSIEWEIESVSSNKTGYLLEAKFESMKMSVSISKNFVDKNTFSTNVSIQNKEHSHTYSAACEVEPLASKDLKDIPTLIADLKHPDLKLRVQAAQELVNFSYEAKSVIPDLLHAIKDESWKVRMWVARVFEKMGRSASEAVDPLIAALSDSDHHVRRAAAKALGKVGGSASRALPALVIAQGDKDKDVRSYASYSVLDIVGEADSALQAQELPKITESLKSKNPNIREAAAKALKWMTPTSVPAVPELIPLLTDSNMSVFKEVCSAFQAMKNLANEAYQPLLVALKGFLQNSDIERMYLINGTLFYMGTPPVSSVPTMGEVLDLSSGRGSEFYSLITQISKSLQELGPKAAAALPALKRASEKTKDGWIKVDIDRAIQVIEGNHSDL